jgi:hypothetical protein
MEKRNKINADDDTTPTTMHMQLPATMAMAVHKQTAITPAMEVTLSNSSASLMTGHVTLYTDPMRDWVNLEVYMTGRNKKCL